MTSRAITITGFALVALAMVALTIGGRLGRLPRVGVVLDALLARRTTRVGLVLVWLWLGWHFLARTDG